MITSVAVRRYHHNMAIEIYSSKANCWATLAHFLSSCTTKHKIIPTRERVATTDTVYQYIVR